MRIPDGATLVCIGDSITDAGRARPVGEGPGLGDGYVAQVQRRLPGVRVLNTGISGHTVRHLTERWQSDVIDLKPDWLSIMIGTNDVWRQFDRLDAPVTPSDYEQLYRALLARTRPLVAGLVVLTPFLVEADVHDPMRARMDEYGLIARRLAAEFGTYFVDTQLAYNTALQSATVADLAPDRVHPTPAGHKVLADALLAAVS